jgi:hypothetical protein
MVGMVRRARLVDEERQMLGMEVNGAYEEEEEDMVAVVGVGSDRIVVVADFCCLQELVL